MFGAFLTYYWVTAKIPGPTAAVLLIPALLLITGVTGMGLGLIASAITAKYRDLTFLIGFGMQLCMYGTTIIYPLSSVPAEYHWLALLNPMRSEECRVGKECVSTCRSRWSPYP